MADDMPEYKAFLLRQPCCVEPCIAPVQVHHAQHGETHGPDAAPAKALGGKRGKGQRASDWWGLPLCFKHHRQLHDGAGPFREMSPTERRAWQDKHIARYRARYAMQETARLSVPGSGRQVDQVGRVLGVDMARETAAERERRRIAAWLRDRAGARHLKVNEAAVLTDAASELEQMTGGDF